MARWGVTVPAVLGVALAVLGGCSGDDSDAATTSTVAPTTAAPTTTTTVPERPASTTTTAYDPAAVEGQIEAAYLRSWDVYADAVYDLELDEAALAEVYADDLLMARQDEIERRVAERRAAFVRVEHDYTITLTNESSAVLVDQYVNHQVLIDADTRQPIEEDPAELIVDIFTLERIGDEWLVTNQERLE